MKRRPVRVAVRSSLKALQDRLRTHGLLPLLAVTSIMAVLSFAGTASIQSILPTDDVGRYTLVSALAAIIGPLAAVGQGGQIIRLYGREEPGVFNWRQDVTRIMRLAFVVVLLLCAGVFLLYETLRPFEVAVVAFLSLLLALIGLTVSVLRSHREYLISAVLLRGPYALAVFVAITAHLVKQQGLAFILLGTATSFLLVAVLGVRSSLRRVPVGTRVLSRDEKAEGTTYVLWTLGDIVGGYGEVALAGAILAPASIALYGVGRNIVRAFDLARGAIDVTLPTEIQKRRNLSLKRLLLPLVLSASALVLVHVVAAPFVLHTLFRGRYDAAMPVVLLLALAGGLRLVHALAHSALIVVDDSRFLKKYLALGFGAEMASLPIIAGMTMSVGIYGTASAVCISWLLRNLVAYGTLYWAKKRRS